MYELLCSRICSAEFRPAHYIFDQTMVHRPGSLALQSIYLNVMALVGMIVLSPLLLVLAIAVKISTRGKILDSVACVGYRGISFPYAPVSHHARRCGIRPCCDDTLRARCSGERIWNSSPRC